MRSLETLRLRMNNEVNSVALYEYRSRLGSRCSSGIFDTEKNNA